MCGQKALSSCARFVWYLFYLAAFRKLSGVREQRKERGITGVCITMSMNVDEGGGRN